VLVQTAPKQLNQCGIFVLFEYDLIEQSSARISFSFYFLTSTFYFPLSLTAENRMPAGALPSHNAAGLGYLSSTFGPWWSLCTFVRRPLGRRLADRGLSDAQDPTSNRPRALP
jgi:hypothetical protein